MKSAIKKIKYSGDGDKPKLMGWLSDIGANTCSKSGNKFVSVGRVRFTAGGNPKGYSRRGGIVCHSDELAWEIFEFLCLHFSKEAKP